MNMCSECRKGIIYLDETGNCFCCTNCDHKIYFTIKFSI